MPHHLQPGSRRSPLSKLRVAFAALLPVTFLAAAGLSVPTAKADPPAPTPVVAAAVQDRPAETTRYWTPERLRSAQPRDVLMRPGKATMMSATLAPRPTGSAVRIPATAPRTGGADTTSRAAGLARLSTGDLWTGPQAEAPATTTGRVFFTSAGADYSCSASAVTSDNRDLVFTAGHCVYEPDMGGFHDNWVFAPGYRDGVEPYDLWPARWLGTSRGWVNGDSAYDIGAARVTVNDAGRHLVDVVGGQGMAWNLSYGETYNAFGYPAAPPFTGERLIYCQGASPGQDTSLSPAALALNCRMTGGSSGGPWLLNFDGRRGVINSVVSYGYRSEPGVLYGPYFGDAARNLYQTAQIG